MEQATKLADLIGKVFGAAAILLYGILFLAYRNYYDVLDVDPEDVGIGNSFILARSPGFILITLAVAAITIGLIGIGASYQRGAMARSDWLRVAGTVVLSFLLAHYFSSLFPVQYNGEWLFWAIFVGLLVIGPVLGALRSRLATVRWQMSVVLTGAVISIALSAVAVSQQAIVRGDRARQGNVVNSFDILTVPVLDVSAPAVSLIWANSAATPPPSIFGTARPPDALRGVLLGQGDTSIIASVRIGPNYRIVKLTASYVVIESDA